MAPGLTVRDVLDNIGWGFMYCLDAAARQCKGIKYEPGYYHDERCSSVMELIHNGTILDEDGRPFPEDISYDQFIDMMIGPGFDIKKDHRKMPGRTRNLLIENNGQMERVILEINDAKLKYSGFAFMPSKGFEMHWTADKSVTDGNVATRELYKDETEEISTRSYELLRASLFDTLQELKATDSFFFGKTKTYKALRSSLTDLCGSIENIREDRTYSNLQYYFEKKDPEDNNLLDAINKFERSAVKQDEIISDRDAVRLSICRKLKKMYKLVKDGAEKEAQLDLAKSDKALSSGLQEKEICEKKVEEARKAFEHPDRKQMLVDDIARKVLMGKLTDSGSAAKDRVLRDVDLYRTLLKKVRKSKEFKKLTSVDTKKLNELSKKTPSKLYKKFKKISAFKGWDAPKKAKSPEEIEAFENSVKEKLSSAENKDAYAICQYMLERTNTILGDFKKVDSFHHSESYKTMIKSISDLHERIYSLDVSELDTETLGSIMKETAEAVDSYQLQHLGDANAHNYYIRERLKLAAEMRICCEYISAPPAEGSEKTFKGLMTDLYAHKYRCGKLDTYLASDSYSLDSINDEFDAEKTWEGKIADDYVAKFADFDSAKGYKAELENIKKTDSFKTRLVGKSADDIRKALVKPYKKEFEPALDKNMIESEIEPMNLGEMV